MLLFSAEVKVLTPWVGVLFVVRRICGALLTYYNLDVKEWVPEPAKSRHSANVGLKRRK